MMQSQPRARIGRVAKLNVLVVAGLGYLVLGLSPELAVLVVAAATLGVLLERVEMP